MNDLSAFQRDLLFVVVSLDDPYGLGIKSELEAYQDREINPGQLYPNLNELAERGYLDKQQQDKRTNRYVPTEKTRRELATRRQWEAERLDEQTPEAIAQ
ncbi:PadR family transcriptional regulator [Halonotius terrestris]|uniref:PadR family transcriptional regulator n=1 Tax=Halonotius terrestris TaxID=2487750 RepID=A0A8J8PAH1_9EURY|nr:PadR family transcriptional regulator [Halonotius terrestris]TQQ79261.1 PadR family transcriptional regulator [Halonotius terrestris]